MRMPWRAKSESISVKQNCFVEILYSPKQLIPSGEMDSEVVQRRRPVRMPWGAKSESISVKQNCLIEILYSPEQVVPSGEMESEVVQRR